MKFITELEKKSKDLQKDLENVRGPLIRLEEIVSYFFKENGKTLEIGSEGEISITLPNGDKNNEFSLSSGEKQVLIMVAHLVFKNENTPLIIDESELSLHIAWQQIFVEALMEASPKTQFILATHSPSILSKAEWGGGEVLRSYTN